MIKPKIVYISVLVLIFFILLAVLLYYLVRAKIFADSPYGQEVARQVRSWDIDFDGNNENVSLVKYNNGRENNFILMLTKDNGSKYSIVLDGFESDTSYCSDSEITIFGQERLICINGYVGAHSQNMQFLLLRDDTLKPVEFINNDSSQNRIASDQPAYSLLKDENGGNIGISIDNRNYDKDPTLDIIRSYYYFKEDAFIFDHSEVIDNLNELNQQGTIN